MASRHALVVGSQCRALRNSPLSFLPARAERLFEVLTDPHRGGCEPAPVSVFLPDPTMKQLKVAVKTAVAQAAKAKAALIFAFIGHAETRDDRFTRPLYLLPRNGNPRKLNSRTGYELGNRLGDLDLGSLDGLILILDACHAGVGVRDVIKHGLDLKDQVRLELLAGTFLREARYGCFSESLIELMEHGAPDLSTDYLDIRHAANAAAGACREVQDPPVYIGSGFGQDISDPGLWVSRNMGSPGHWPLSGTAEGALAVALTRSFQMTDVMEPVAEALETSRLTVVIGEVGSGKSTLVSALARPELVPFVTKRFLSAVGFTTLSHSLVELAERLAAQLNRTPGFKEAAASYRLAFDDEAYEAQPALERLVFGPLRKVTIRIGDRIRLAIDGIDRLEPEARTELARVLAAAAKDPALKRAGILVTSHPAVLPELDCLADAVRIGVDRPRPDEIITYLIGNGVREQMAKALASHSWTWLELQLLADLERRMAGTGEHRTDLGSLYDQLIASATAAGGEVQAVLVVLAAAGTGPNLPIGVAAAACSLVQAAANRPGSQNAGREGGTQVPLLRRILADLGAMVVRADPGTDAERLGLFHETFTNHVREHHGWGQSVKAGHAAILNALRTATDPAAVAYRQTRGPDHFWALGRYHEALTTVMSGLGLRAADNRSLIELWTERAREVLPPIETDLLNLRSHLARWTAEAGNLADAIEQGHRLLEDRTRILGPDDPGTLATRDSLARWIGEAGRVDEAIKQYRRLLEDRMRILRPDDPDILATRGSLARWTAEAGKVSYAIDQGHRLLEDRKRILGPDDPGTLDTRGSLADWTAEAGKVDEAIEQFRRLLEDRRRILGPDHPKTLATRGSLAHWTGEAGKVDEAIKQFRRLLADRTRILGPDHPKTLTTRHRLAAWTGESGKVDEAIKQFRQLLADRTRILEPDHPDTLSGRASLVRWIGEAGNVDEAVGQYRRLLADRTRILGPDHPDTLTSRADLARWIGEAGNVDEAVGQFRQLMADRKRILGPDHPKTLKARASLARWIGEAGNVDEAVGQFRQLLEDRKRILGPDHPNTLTTRADLATWTAKAGKVTEAVGQFRRLLEDQTRILGPDHPNTLTTRGGLAHWTAEAGEVTEAIKQFRRLLEDQTRILGPDHPKTLATRGSLAHWTREAGKVDEAIKQFRQLLEDQTRILGPDHPDTLATRNNLARWTGGSQDTS
jgi:NTP pyrophosphatase (non-canonical NTP hydrolase)